MAQLARRPLACPPSYRIWDYVGLAIANTVILLAILGFRRHLHVLCSRWISWLHLPNHRGPRRLIFAASIWLILSFQLRLLCGFYFPGIHGWHYNNLMSSITQELPDGIVLGESVDEPFLAGGILPENARYLPKTGYLTSGVMFLHFRGGEVLPGNYELTEIVFPQYIFGQLYEEIIEPELFFDVVRRSIDRRRQNRKFLLPLSIAYPNHMPYNPLPHDQFPPGAELEAVSLWDLTIHVNAERQVEVVAAHEKNRIYDR
ncbi:MAG: hypothetical protein O7C75_17925 [Verrucomicrobia bacterium]|nr:hypothetical protein [Verrucomicrobiota bacterium]